MNRKIHLVTLALALASAAFLGVLAAQLQTSFRQGCLLAGAGALMTVLASITVFRFHRTYLEGVRASEEKYRHLAENSVDGLWVMDGNFRFTYVNRAVQPLLGYSVEEWVGTSLERHCSPEDFQRVRAAALTAANDAEITRDGTSTEIDLIRKDGTIVPAEVTARPFRGSDGELQFQGITRDITERRTREAALCRSEGEARSAARALEAVFRASPLAMVSLDASGRVLRWNPAAEKIFGWSEKEALGRVLPLVPAPFLDQFRALREEVLAGGSLTGVELRRECKDGSPIQIRVSAAPLPGEGEQPGGIMAVLEDTTREREAADRLAEQRNLLQAIFDHAPAMMALSGANGEWRLVNRCFRETLGWTLKELNAGPAPSSQVYGDSEQGRGIGGGTRQGPGEWADYRTLTSDGTVLDTTWATVDLTEGSKLSIGRDVTEEKELERQLRRMNEELEARVRERTGALEAANRELETFTCSVSHDLKAPLRIIEGRLETLAEVFAAEDRPGEIQRLLDGLQADTGRMNRLVDDLLEFSRFGRMPLCITRIELSKLAQAVTEDLAEELEDRGVDLAISDLPSVTGDPRMLRQVFLNLLSNAVKFTAASSHPRIRLESRAQGSEWIIAVSDNGIGFDPDYEDRLFGIFQRLHHPDDYPGNGVGLASVRRIVERHGGRVWARGQLGEGASFSFSLPMSPLDPEEQAGQEPHLSEPDREEGEGPATMFPADLRSQTSAGGT